MNRIYRKELKLIRLCSDTLLSVVVCLSRSFCQIYLQNLLLAEESSLLFVEDCLNNLDGVKVTYYLAGYSKRKMSLQSYYKVWLSAMNSDLGVHSFNE